MYKKLITALVLVLFVFLLFISVPTYVNNECNIFPFPSRLVLGLPWKKIPCSYHGLMWGNSLIEQGINLKKQIDQSGFYFLMNK